MHLVLSLTEDDAEVPSLEAECGSKILARLSMTAFWFVNNGVIGCSKEQIHS